MEEAPSHWHNGYVHRSEEHFKGRVVNNLMNNKRVKDLIERVKLGQLDEGVIEMERGNFSSDIDRVTVGRDYWGHPTIKIEETSFMPQKYFHKRL